MSTFRKVVGSLSLVVLLAFIIAPFVGPSSSHASSFNFWDILIVISWCGYVLFAVVTFLGMILNDRIKTPTFLNQTAIILWFLTIAITILSVAGVSPSGEPVPAILNFVFTGMFMVWPVVISLDWLYKAQFEAKAKIEAIDGEVVEIDEVEL